MASKKSTDVMIAGKIYTLSGYEEEGYLQRVASYINAKISEITEREEFRRIPNDMKSILIQLNIADDYFKARSQYETLEGNYKKAEKDLFELKHELVDTQMKVEELLEKLASERSEAVKKSETEQNLEEKCQKLEHAYQALLENAKVSDEKNRQFEEMLRLTEKEKRDLESANQELRLNKERLETALADALLGSCSQEKKNEPAAAELTEEEITELLSPTVNEIEDNISSVPSVFEKEYSAQENSDEQDDEEPMQNEALDEEEPLEKVPLDDEEAVQKKTLDDEDLAQAALDEKEASQDEGSAITDISEEDDPELQELARQIAELDRLEKAEKLKKKNEEEKMKRK